MAQTNIKFTIKEDDVSNFQKASSNTQSTKSGSSPNTGFFTEEGVVSKDIVSTVSSPVVSGIFLFAGIILLLALVAKIKKNKTSNFKDSLTRKRYTTRILGFAAFLTLAAGLGGTMARFIGVKAESEDFTTSGTIEASLVEIADNYKLYCATDQISINKTTVPYGYLVLMHADENGEDTLGGTLASATSGVETITSVQDWADLAIGQWGYFVGDQEESVYNPMPVNYGIIANETENTRTTEIPVTYCAKIDKNINEASFSTVADYEFASGDENDIYPEIDFNSSDDEDGDGLLNREENRYGMNPLSADTDLDSLSDYDELKVHHTDPLVEDTDEDGLVDYSEIALNEDYGTDPLSSHSCTASSCDSTKLDGEQTYTYSDELSDSNISYTVTGAGDVPLTYIEAVDPIDIDESLGDLAGKAYIFQSAGEVEDAEITVPYIHSTDEANNESANDTEEDFGESYGAVEVDDEIISEDNMFALALSYEEDAENEDTATLVPSSSTVSVDQSARTISLNVTDSQQILLVGNQQVTDNELGEIMGASSSKKVSIKTAIKTVATKVKTFVQKVVDLPQKLKCEKSGLAWDPNTRKCYQWNEYNCIQKGKVWDSNRALCKYAYAWSVENNFKAATDGFRAWNNHGYYDEENDDLYIVGGNCFGMSLLARLLYKGKISFSDHHLDGYVESVTVADDHIYKSSQIRDFSLKGLNKTKVLNAEAVQKEVNAQFVKGVPANTGRVTVSVFTKAAGRAIFALQNYYFNGNVSGIITMDPNNRTTNPFYASKFIKVSPNNFIDQMKTLIDKNKNNDPIVIDAMGSNSGHAVNAISIGHINEKNSTVQKYEIIVYDNNGPIETLWEIECSTIVCVATQAYAGTGNFQLEFNKLVDDNYFLNH